MKKKLFMTLISVVLALSATACKQNPTVSTVTENSVKASPMSQKGGSKSLSISLYRDYYNIAGAVKLFKQTHPDVEITVHTYGEDAEKYKAQAVTNLMAGTSDDILDETGIPYTKLADRGLLAGFYPLMEKDSSFHKHEYYANVFKAFDYKKQLYVFPVDFAYNFVGVNNTLGKELVTKFSQNKTISDRSLLDLYKNTPNKAGFYVKGTFNTQWVINSNINQFIDYEKKTASFNSKDFIQLISDTMAVAEPKKDVKTNSQGLGINKDDLSVKKYLFKDISIGNYEYFLPYKEFQDFTYCIPARNSNGQVNIGSLTRFCISEKSKNKELAWEFLKFLTLPETCTNLAYGNMFPVNKEAFKTKITAVMENAIKHMETQQGYYLSGDNVKYVSEAISYFDQCNQLPMLSNMLETEAFGDIVATDSDMLDNGLMTPEQVASDLQNKITLSLTE